MNFIPNIIKKDQSIKVYKYDGKGLEPINTLFYEDGLKICFIDLETTGLDKFNSEIIEIAMKVVLVNEKSGDIINVIDEYESLQQPDGIITQTITNVTGITNEMVEGRSIDWNYVNNIVQSVDIMVAHNARFDRGFFDLVSDFSKEKIWCCSVNDINWSGLGFSSKKQEMLCMWHGFYYSSHRAMNDVNALIHLVTHKSYTEEKPLKQIIESSKESIYRIYAENFKYDEEKKNIVKNNNYRWDPVRKVWSKEVKFEELESEKIWLTEVIYDDTFLGRVMEISNTNKYK